MTSLISRYDSYHNATHIKMSIVSLCHAYHVALIMKPLISWCDTYHNLTCITMPFFPPKSLASWCHSYHNVTRVMLHLIACSLRAPCCKDLCACAWVTLKAGLLWPQPLFRDTLSVCIMYDVTSREMTSRIILMFVVVVAVVVAGTSPGGRYSETLNSVCVSLWGLV
jgi:hypothetical protein